MLLPLTVVKGDAERRIQQVIVHYSASAFGDALVIDSWHRERDFDCIGYHFVVLNGHRDCTNIYQKRDDGLIEMGRAEDRIGAHAKSNNEGSIGICMIGSGVFTRWQFTHLLWLVASLHMHYDFALDNVLGHCEVAPIRSPHCPGFNMELLRAALGAWKLTR